MMDTQTKVLIVEDDPNVVRLVTLYLKSDGHEVISAFDGELGLQLAQTKSPDLIVLDIMMPKMDGMEVCREVRKQSNVPIVMLTARVEEEDVLAGLDLGADDYVTKPFSPKQLAARVRAVLRRTARDAEEVETVEELQYQDITVNVDSRAVSVGDVPVKLTPTEYRLLVQFVREPARVFSRDQIIERAFGYDFDGFDRTVDTHVFNLRKKLEAASGHPRYIQTVYGMGYRLDHG
jgi:DNA-binding response OmpR family regulator